MPLRDQQPLNDGEQAAARRLIGLAPIIDRWEELFRKGHPAIHPASSLAADDERSAPFHMSHAVWLALSHAIDNFHAFRVATVVGQYPNCEIITRPYGEYPTLRAAMENAAAALWMLGPKSRNERLIRRFRWLMQDARQKDAVLSVTTKTTAAYDQRHETLLPLLAQNGLELADCVRRINFREVVREAAGYTEHLSADACEIRWRILSAMTHGDLWASMSVTDREERGEKEDGVVRLRLTSSVDRVAHFGLVVYDLLKPAYVLLDLRRKQH